MYLFTFIKHIVGHGIIYHIPSSLYTNTHGHTVTHYFVLDTHVHMCMKLWDTETHSRKWSHQYYSFFIHECVHNDGVVVVMMITSFFKRRVDDSTCDMSDSVTLTETIPCLRKGTVFVLCIIITDKQKIQVVITDNILKELSLTVFFSFVHSFFLFLFLIITPHSTLQHPGSILEVWIPRKSRKTRDPNPKSEQKLCNLHQKEGSERTSLDQR